MEILNNPTFQTVLGAFLGAVLGWLFSLMSSSPKSEYSNLTIVETKTIVKNEYRAENKKESVDPFSIIIIIVGALVFGAFGYVKFNKQVFDYVYIFELFNLGFIFTTFMVALILGRVSSREWLTRIIFPIVTFILIIFIFRYLKNNIPESIIQKANEVEIFEFIRSLTTYGRSFLMYQLISFVLAILLSILSLLNFINYFALMNLRGTKGLKTWYYIHKYTKIGSGAFYYVFTIIFMSIILLIQTDWFKNTVLVK